MTTGERNKAPEKARSIARALENAHFDVPSAQVFASFLRGGLERITDGVETHLPFDLVMKGIDIALSLEERSLNVDRELLGLINERKQLIFQGKEQNRTKAGRKSSGNHALIAVEGQMEKYSGRRDLLEHDVAELRAMLEPLLHSGLVSFKAADERNRPR